MLYKSFVDFFKSLLGQTTFFQQKRNGPKNLTSPEMD